MSLQLRDVNNIHVQLLLSEDFNTCMKLVWRARIFSFQRREKGLAYQTSMKYCKPKEVNVHNI